MPIPILTLISACVLAVLASIVMSWASNRSALWNMAFGGVLALAVLVGALIIAYVFAWMVYPS
jgi:hypothetical protein